MPETSALLLSISLASFAAAGVILVAFLRRLRRGHR